MKEFPMTINTDTSMNQLLSNTITETKEVSATTNFEAELQRELIDNLKTQEDPTQTQSDSAVEEFKRELSSKGALQYLQDLNAKKIEALIEKKKEELTESLGLGDTTQPPLTGEAKETALNTLESLLSDYKKQLMEQMRLSNEDTTTETNPTTLTSLLETL